VRCRTDGKACCGHPDCHAGHPIGTTPRAIAPIHLQESIMNKDQVKGRVKQAAGKIKETAGKLSGNKSLEQKGKVRNAAGDAQAAKGDLKNDIQKSH
jgi:uncharacterized protein YjbJ (UPF0337 family)